MPKLSFQIENENILSPSQLHVVPAVHFRLAFAEEVHRLCSDLKTRPSAIAVELGPAMTAEVRRWLEDLGVKPGVKLKSLPCMLGLVHVNRLLHPRVRKRFESLRQEKNDELNEFTPDLLKEMLGYSSARVLYLSPVDSVIEAIRCSIELDIPLYGVDLEETADAFRAPCSIQDPILASGNVESYVTRNIAYAEIGRDDYIDHRREFAMAARLKSVLARHERVLFTCGLSHWNKIKSLLFDKTITPARLDADFLTDKTGGEFERVLVDPLLALYHMDLFPRLVKRYERLRNPADWGEPPNVSDLVSIKSEFQFLLKETYRKYFVDQRGEDSQLNRQQKDWEVLLDFERMMTNLAAIRLQAVPDIFTALISAHGTMSDIFFQLLFKQFIEFEWAKPDDFPKLDILSALPTPIHGHMRGKLTSRKNKQRHLLYIDPLPGGGGGHYKVKIPFIWSDEFIVDDEPRLAVDPLRVTWPPCDDRMMAMSLHAAKLALLQTSQVHIQPFEGSLMDGLQVKTTLREFARGREIHYVYERMRPKKSGTGLDINPFPIVWIFRPGPDVEAKWYPYGRDFSELIASVRDKSDTGRVDISRLEWIKNKIGDRVDFFLALMKQNEMPHSIPSQIHINRFDIRGYILFIPSFFRHIMQETVWIDRTALEEKESCRIRGPVRPSDVDIITHMRNKHGIDLTLPEWHITLVRIAIHYAEDTVTVVIPDGLMLPSSLYREAMRRQVQIRVVPLSYFPQQALRKLSVLYNVPGYYNQSGWGFPEIISRILGETPNDARNLVPERWLQYGLESWEMVPPYSNL